MTHLEVCEANICQDDPEKHLRNWYPDEAICNKKPFTHWQKVQRRIQRLYLKGRVSNEKYFSHALLESLIVVRPGIKGLKPEDGFMPSLDSV